MSSSLRLPICGRNTLTGSAAEAWVLAASAVCDRDLLNHVNSPKTQSATGIIRNQTRRECFPAGLGPGSEAAVGGVEGCSCEWFKTSSCDMGFLRIGVVSSGPRADDSEDSGHEEECGDSGEQKPADDGTSETRMLFVSLAPAECHRHHADC